MRGPFAAFAVVLAATGCSSSSTSSTAGDAEAPDAAESADAAPPDAHVVDAALRDAVVDAATTEIVIDAASFPLADGGGVVCGVDYDGVVVFYAATGDPMPTETGILSCAAPIVIAPVEPATTYQLDVYAQQGATVVAEAICSATTQGGASVAPMCPPFM